MKEQEALQILDNLVKQIKLTRDEHVQVQIAVETLKKVINSPPKK